MALATNGTLVTERVAAKIADTGFSRVAISVDGADAGHARSVSRPARCARAGAARPAQPARRRRLGPDQLDDREAQRHRAAGAARPRARDRRRRAARVHARAGRLRPRARARRRCCRPTNTSACSRWFDEQSKDCPIDLKATCAPHYYRIRAQRIEDERSRGDLTSTFIAPGTRAKAAPTLLGGGAPRPAPVGDDARLPGRHQRLLRVERRRRLSMRLPARERRRHAPSRRSRTSGPARRCFEQLRDPQAYDGKCGECRYEAICGGCRARAYAATGSFLAEEPFCTYRPRISTRERLPDCRHRSRSAADGRRIPTDKQPVVNAAPVVHLRALEIVPWR